jgi:pimeloyl-ACP methyl ester carboxylesterase
MPKDAKLPRKISFLLNAGRWVLLAFALFWIAIGIFAFWPIDVKVGTTAFPNDIGGEPDAIIILVHGTFSPDANWTQPTFPLVRAIESRFQGARVQFYRFDWWGLMGGSLNNTHFQRYAASIKLSELVTHLRSSHPTAHLFVVAHSHGGNVALYAARRAPGIEGIVTMGTPFIEIEPRDIENDIALRWSTKVIVFVAWYAMLIGSAILGLAGMGLAVQLFEYGNFFLKVLGGILVFISLPLMLWQLEVGPLSGADLSYRSRGRQDRGSASISPEPIMELISTPAIWVSVSIVLINMLSDMFGILPISIPKAAIMLVSANVAEAYLVIKNWSISAFIRTDRSLVLSNSSSSRLRSSGASTMLCLHMFKPIPFLFPAPGGVWRLCSWP